MPPPSSIRRIHSMFYIQMDLQPTKTLCSEEVARVPQPRSLKEGTKTASFCSGGQSSRSPKTTSAYRIFLACLIAYAWVCRWCVIVYLLYPIFANLKRSLLNSFRISCWQVILGSINWMGCNAFCDLQLIKMCLPATLNSQSGDFIWNKKWMGSLQNPPAMIRNIPEFI